MELGRKGGGMTYNADIAHCVGTGCPLADKCRRFQLYKIWKEMEKKEWHTSFVEPRYSNGKCENLIEI